VKVLLFVGTNFRGFHKLQWPLGSWIRGLEHYRQQSMGKLYFVGFWFSWFQWTMKSTKIRTPRLIMISQYFMDQYHWEEWYIYHNDLLRNAMSLTTVTT